MGLELALQHRGGRGGEEEMQRGWMERTWPSRNGQDLGTRERRGSTMVHQEGPAVTQPRQSGSRAGWKGGG